MLDLLEDVEIEPAAKTRSPKASIHTCFPEGSMTSSASLACHLWVRTRMKYVFYRVHTHTCTRWLLTRRGEVRRGCHGRVSSHSPFFFLYFLKAEPVSFLFFIVLP